ncbi:MAG: glycosyltransferase family 39 protein [Candidatus Omnitrophota bacterium]|nr:glycosyltransferase family 39 protein [Candidatus Omnitrophota bacterium]
MSSSKNLLPLIVIIIACAILFFVGLGKRGLWSPDETRYAIVSKEMVDSGDWIMLHRNGEIYAQKPPVFFWLISIFSILLGRFSEFSVRLPSALAATGGAVITYFFAKKLFNKRVALFSSLILVTSLAYLGAARWVILDPLLTFFAISAIYLLYLGLDKQNTRLITYSLAFILMALGTLTKGPVGFILPLLAIIPYAYFIKNMRSLFTKEFTFGFIIFILTVLAWLVPACVRGGEAYTKELLLNQIFGRFVEAFDHKEPFYFYFIRFPLEFMPWTVFLPAAVIFLIKNKMGENAVKLIFIWFISIFLFFTISKSKNDLYILPLYPAAAIAVAYYWENRINGRPRTLIYIVAAMIILNTLLTYLVFPLFDVYKSPKYFSQKIVKYVRPDDSLMTFRTNPVYWLYYCNRRQIKELGTYEDLDKYLKADNRVFCIIENNDYEEFMRSYKIKAYALEKETFYGRKKTFVLISNRYN